MDAWNDPQRGTPATDIAPDSRPGVPMNAEPEPRGTEREIDDQPGREEREHRTALPEATPVFGTAQPLRGASGVLRRIAYRMPEHRARHWMLLLAADRTDVLESRLGEAVATPLERAGMARTGARLRANPVPVLATALAGVWLARKLF